MLELKSEIFYQILQSKSNCNSKKISKLRNKVDLKDNLYGNFLIKEPVLIDLIKSAPLQRLKNVSQFGVPDTYYSRKNYNRLEHSIGVMLLLRILGATIEEQIAGLLHDVSTPAFSHVIDWVLSEGNKGKENYHDSLHREFIMQSDVKQILKKHNYSYEQFTDLSRFSLLENELPNLCADRADYSLREIFYFKDKASVQNYLKSLSNHNEIIVFNNRASAKNFAYDFLGLQLEHWGSYDATARYYLFAKALKIALSIGLFHEKDLYLHEKQLIDRLEGSENPQLTSILKDLKKSEIGIKAEEKVFKKFRFVDPLFLEGRKIVRLSSVDKEFKRLINEHLKISAAGLII